MTVPAKAGIVYVATDMEGRVKIGFTSGPLERRMRQLSSAVGYHMFCLAGFPGTRKEEGLLHERFARWRLQGEWFSDCAEIRDWVAKNQ